MSLRSSPSRLLWLIPSLIVAAVAAVLALAGYTLWRQTPPGPRLRPNMMDTPPRFWRDPVLAPHGTPGGYPAPGSPPGAAGSGR
jgi:hypothetical protein